MTLRIPRAEMAKIRDHARAAYPEECCGFLIGTPDAPRTVREARAVANVAKDNRRRRYEVDARETLALERELRERGMQNVGFYHSHPDHPAHPSGFDRDRAAWEGMAYLIVSVESGNPVDARAWVIQEGGDGAGGPESARSFREEDIELL
jgi:proteasome lid subunit RPN8/RPN11